MALIVENGEALPNAESYLSVADADVYQANRGITLWATMSTTEKEWSLRRATDYMFQAYGRRWAGRRVTNTQSLDWPRYGITVGGYDLAFNVVPVAIRNACAELAFRAARSDLAPDIGRLKTKVKVGPIETEYAAGSGLTRFTAVDNLLSAYMENTGSMIRLVRA